MIIIGLRIGVPNMGYNPLNKIPILEIKKAGYSIDSFSLVYGEVLYDYLKNE